MSAFFEIIKREIKRLKDEKFLLLIMIILPFLSSIVLFQTFSKGSATDLPIAILDYDNSDISRKLVRMIDSTPSVRVEYKLNDTNMAYNLVQQGDIYAFLVIPKNFKRDISRNLTPDLAYYYNNQTILIGGILTKDIQSAVLTFSGEVNASLRMKKGMQKEAVKQKVNIIRIDERLKGNPYMNYSYFLSFAGVAHTFQVFILFFAIWAVGREFREGTFKEWLAIADNSIVKAIFSKLTFYTIYFLFAMLFMYAVYYFVYKAPFEGNIFILTLSTLLYILAYEFVGVLFVSILSNLRFSMSCGAFMASMGFSMAGMTYPVIAMPWFGKFYSALLPIRPYVKILIDQSLRGFQPKYDLIYLVWLIGFICLGMLFLPLLKKHGTDEKLWYQI